MRAAVLSVALAFGLGVSGTALGASTWCVDGSNGSDANDGTAFDAAHAFKTIKKAYDAAAAGDTIEVADGSYAEFLTVEKTLTFRGRGRVVIEKSDGWPGTWRLNASFCTVEGFTFRDIDTWALLPYYVAGTRVINCTFIRCSYAFQTYYVGKTTVDGCLFWDCGPGAVLSAGSGLTVTRCTFALNRGDALYIWESPYLSTFKNCLFYGNYGNAVKVANVGGGTPPRGFLEVGPNAYFGNAADFAGPGAALAVGANDITGIDPQLLDPLKGDFFLRPTSPLAGAGTVEDGKRNSIGAFGPVAVADGPSTQASTPGFPSFANWKDVTGGAPGVAVGSGTSFFVIDQDGALELPAGITAGTARSPVFDMGGMIDRIFYKGQEQASLPSGARRIVEADNATRHREVRFRVSLTSFAETDTTIPWQTTLWGQPIQGAAGRYGQLEVTLRRDGN